MKHVCFFLMFLCSVVACHYEPTMDLPSGKASELYVMGVEALDSGKVERALLHFLVAEHEASEDKDFRQAFLAAMEIGGMAEQYHVPDLAKEVGLRTLEYARKTGDKADLAAAEASVGRAYALEKAWNLAVPYLDRAVKLYRKEKGEEAGLCAALTARASVAVAQKDWEVAAECFREIDTLPEAFCKPCEQEIALDKTIYYMGKGENSLAEKEVLLAIESENLYIQKDAYRKKYELELQKDNVEAALEAFEHHIACYKALKKDKTLEKVIVLPLQYKTELIKENIYWLKLKTRVVQILTVIVIIVGTSLIWKKRRQLQRLNFTTEYMSEVIKNLNRKLSQSWENIQKYKELYESLSAADVEEREIMEKHLAKLVNDMLKLEKRSDNIMEEITEWRKKFIVGKSTIEENPIYTSILLLKLKKEPKYIQDDQWEEIYFLMDLMFDDFTQRFKAAYPDITESDFQYCCLFKVGFSIRQIATMMGVASTSVSRKKLKIREHMHLEKKMDVGKVCKKF